MQLPKRVVKADLGASFKGQQRKSGMKTPMMEVGPSAQIPQTESSAFQIFSEETGLSKIQHRCRQRKRKN